MLRFHKQEGFALIETIVGLVLVGIVGTGISTFAVQTVTETNRSNAHMHEIQQLENVGYWVSRDVQMAQTITPGASAGFPLVVYWEDENGNTFEVTFSVDGTQFQRSLVKNGGAPQNLLVGQSIDSSASLTNCNYSEGLLTLNVTSSVQQWSMTRTYQIKKRPW